MALLQSAPAVGVDIGDGTVDIQPNATPITGLTPCTTYFFRVAASNTNGTVFGDILQFTTDCKPSVTTLPAAPSSAVTATLNGSLNPNGDPARYHTKYHFEYGLTSTYGSVTPDRNSTTGHDHSEEPVAGEPIGGLTESTTYHYRIVGVSDLGTSQGLDATFTTPPSTGPAGPQGTPGTNGTNGTNGVNGTNGAAGATGPTGTPGAQGVQGVTGSTGPAGKQGPSGLNGSDLIVQNGKGLLTIKSKTVLIGLSGRRAGQVRMPIFCTKKTGRSCAGTFKVRTINKINPSTTGKHFAKRRVTFFTGDYQLKLGALGVVIGELQPEKLDLARKIKSVAVQLSITVTDSIGNRQTIVQNGRLIARAHV
jgi:hypothetical protein